jgi:hypothetical protein
MTYRHIQQYIPNQLIPEFVNLFNYVPKGLTPLGFPAIENNKPAGID